MERLVLVRHGETAWNSDNRVQGSMDVPLSPKGIEQAEALAAHLARSGCRFDLSFTSDLARARETAAVLTRALGIPPAETSPLLREVHCGRWEGRNVEDLRRAESEDFWRWRGESDFRIPGGESILDVRERVRAFFGEREQVLRGARRILLVGHGIFNRMVLSEILDLDPQKSRHFAQDNTAVNLFVWHGGRPVCLAWNTRPHLPAEDFPCGRPDWGDE